MTLADGLAEIAIMDRARWLYLCLTRIRSDGVRANCWLSSICGEVTIHCQIVGRCLALTVEDLEADNWNLVSDSWGLGLRSLEKDSTCRRLTPRPPDGWVCFHCGERFLHQNDARDHFGFDPGSQPACQFPPEYVASGLRQFRCVETDLRSILGELRDLQDTLAGPVETESAASLQRLCSSAIESIGEVLGTPAEKRAQRLVRLRQAQVLWSCGIMLHRGHKPYDAWQARLACARLLPSVGDTYRKALGLDHDDRQLR